MFGPLLLTDTTELAHILLAPPVSARASASELHPIHKLNPTHLVPIHKLNPIHLVPPAQLPEHLLVFHPLRVELLRVRLLELLHLLEQGFNLNPRH